MVKIICTECRKEFVGMSEKSVTYMLNQHYLTQHPEKVRTEHWGEKNEDN